MKKVLQATMPNPGIANSACSAGKTFIAFAVAQRANESGTPKPIIEKTKPSRMLLPRPKRLYTNQYENGRASASPRPLPIDIANSKAAEMPHATASANIVCPIEATEYLFLSIVLSQKHSVRRIGALVPIRITEVFQMTVEIRQFRFRDLDAGQYPTVIGAVIPVVEQADVPAIADG